MWPLYAPLLLLPYRSVEARLLHPSCSLSADPVFTRHSPVLQLSNLFTYRFFLLFESCKSKKKKIIRLELDTHPWSQVGLCRPPTLHLPSVDPPCLSAHPDKLYLSP